MLFKCQYRALVHKMLIVLPVILIKKSKNHNVNKKHAYLVGFIKKRVWLEVLLNIVMEYQLCYFSCAAAGNPFGLTRGFERNSFDIRPNGRYDIETEPFVFVPDDPDSHQYFLGCYVTYCYGDFDGINSLTDNCQYVSSKNTQYIWTHYLLTIF